MDALGEVKGQVVLFPKREAEVNVSASGLLANIYFSSEDR